MNHKLFVDNREYLVFNNNLNIVRASDGVRKYAYRSEEIIPGEDVSLSFPELIGLEAVCEAILNGEQEQFVLDSISRNLDENTILYFNLYIKKIEENLILLLEDVTELMSLRQSLIQRVNEAEVVLSQLKRFEYCTNKIVASMGDVLFITTRSGTIERVNKATIELFGYKKAELLQKSIDTIINNENFNHQQIYTSLLNDSNSVETIEIACKTKQQKLIQIEFNCFVVPTEIEGFLNCVYIGRDITSRKQAEIEIRKALEQEKELRELKSGFISMASHEFRNPLSSILICAQTLADSENISRPEQEFYLQSIRDAALNMQSLLEDILILSKTEAGKQKYNPTKLNLMIFCRQIIQELESTYLERTIDLNIDNDFSQVYFDAKLLWHILTNLLSNALKYSPPSEPVELRVSFTEDRTKAIIEVCDRGMGIPQESQKHLFESFYRASNVGDIPGTGLGMSIVKKAVESHQGTIKVESEINVGTKVRVILPVTNDSKRAN
ncbi:MAG: ATP-binding protein [Pleurocapsa sp.]